MTCERSNQHAYSVRILALAISVAFAAAACKPASQNAPAADQPATAPEQAAPAPADTSRAPDTGAAPVGLHELDESARTAPLGDATMCRVDEMSGEPLVSGQTARLALPSAAVFRGWLGDESTKSWPQPPPSLRFDQVDGGRAWEVGLGAPLSRKDVAKYFHSDTMEASGFKVPVDLSALPAGDYTVRMVYDRAGRRMACDRRIRVRIGS